MSTAVDGVLRNSVGLVISYQDTGTTHTFDKSLNKVYNMKLNECIWLLILNYLELLNTLLS